MSYRDQSTSARPPAVAGLFYRDDAGLASEVRRYIDAGVTSALVPRAIIVPHAGYVYSGPVAGSGYRALANLDRAVRRVYLLGPAHRVYTRGVAAPSHRAFATPLGEVAVDRACIERFVDAFDFVHVDDDPHREEHSLEVQLPFLVAALDDFTVVPLVVGDIEPSRLEALVDLMLDDGEGLVVVSSDLSHYLGYADAKLADTDTIGRMEGLKWRELGADNACGFIPVAALLACAARRGLEVSALDVRNSGDTAGPRDAVVGYASLVVHEPAARFDTSTRRRLLGVARDAIGQRLAGRSVQVAVEDWPFTCARHGASFVTLTRDGELRGCIGTLEPREPLVTSVANNAVRAAFNDPRFTPLQPGELDEIAVAVSVLSPPVPMRFASQPDLLDQLRPGVDGLVLTCGRRRGTFLPSVWSQLPTPLEFLGGLKRKAGLSEHFWSADIRVERYTTESFGEHGA